MATSSVGCEEIDQLLCALLWRQWQASFRIPMSSVRVQKRYKGKIKTIRCSTDCNAIVESILSQSIAHAKTDGWACQTVQCVVECIRSHVSSKTLTALNSAVGFLLESITVLRKSVKDVSWKEEESRSQAMFPQCAAWQRRRNLHLLLLWLSGRRACALLS
eukprot:4413929-Karenia_brevis.AAC.1